ncbi:MAG: hypothetical protein HOM11_11455 [Methylococcales bacterium]|nr:hypothetical protein [Methylococcales bacterium]MBT7444406.1 hypothetical protein [Methylococcales bacterium]
MKLFLIGVVITVIAGMAGYHLHRESEPRATQLKPVSLPDISGMASFLANQYLFVSDTKKAQHQLFLLEFVDAKTPFSFKPVTLSDPNQLLQNNPVKDLEAICALPGSKRRFMLFESQKIKGVGGRALEVQLPITADEAVITTVVPLPAEFVKRKQGWNLEGALCFVGANGQLTYLLSDRGAEGKARLLKAVVEQGQFVVQQTWLLALTAPTIMGREQQEGLREISDLYFSDNGEVWTVMTTDPDYRAGPFYSAIMKIGRLEQGTFKLQLDESSRRDLTGLKVEALAKPPVTREGEVLGQFLVGTDDEALGGVLRIVE